MATKKTTARKPRTPKTISRLDSKRATIQANRAAVKKLKDLAINIALELNLDEDRMAKRIDAAMRSEYGAINGLVNLTASIANWPAEPGDGNMVSANRAVLEDKFNLDLMLLEDIRTFKGYHTFVTDELVIMAGVEPMYEDYADYCQIFLEELGLEANRPTIEQSKWENREAKAKEQAKEDLLGMQDDLAKHKAFIEAQAK